MIFITCRDKSAAGCWFIQQLHTDGRKRGPPECVTDIRREKPPVKPLLRATQVMQEARHTQLFELATAGLLLTAPERNSRLIRAAKSGNLLFRLGTRVHIFHSNRNKARPLGKIYSCSTSWVYFASIKASKEPILGAIQYGEQFRLST